MITMTIISMLAALALPGLKTVKRRATATAIGSDLRTFAAAFDGYIHETGAWPAEVAAGVLPPEMASRIHPTSWLRTTPLGGQYNWDNNQMHAGTRYRAVIAITNTATSPYLQDVDLLEAIDRAIDNGDLYSGNFRLGDDDEPIYIVAQ
jgi:type II secretory pathway pseudopilin PulG